MTANISIIAKLLNVKNMHIEKVTTEDEAGEKNGEKITIEKVVVECRPIKRIQKQCPICRQTCPGYDTKHPTPSTWRGPNLNGMIVEVKYLRHRIECPEHGCLSEYVPWQDGNTRFLPDFNNEAAYLAMNASKTTVCEFMNVNWRTVGHCIEAVHDRLEPDPNARIKGLKRLSVDETSRSAGHKYITVVRDLDRNNVVWLHDNHGDTVFEEFCASLSEEQRAAIEVVAGDGAGWIDRMCKKYFPNAKRCVDFFHVVAWVNDALDKLRSSLRNKAEREYEKLEAQFKADIKQRRETDKALKRDYENAQRELAVLRRKKGRPSKRRKELEVKIATYEATFQLDGTDDTAKARYGYTGEQLSMLDLLMDKKKAIKDSKYALLNNQENLSDKYKEKIDLIEVSYPELYQAYQLKERLRVILHLKIVELAKEELQKWIDDAKNSGINPFVKVAEKVERHADGIIRAIECNANSAKSEATNTTIKAMIKVARGFTNVENLFALIMLRCSELVIPLRNRNLPNSEKKKELREKANERRRSRLYPKTVAPQASILPTQNA